MKHKLTNNFINIFQYKKIFFIYFKILLTIQALRLTLVKSFLKYVFYIASFNRAYNKDSKRNNVYIFFMKAIL